MHNCPKSTSGCCRISAEGGANCRKSFPCSIPVNTLLLINDMEPSLFRARYKFVINTSGLYCLGNEKGNFRSLWNSFLYLREKMALNPIFHSSHLHYLLNIKSMNISDIHIPAQKEVPYSLMRWDIFKARKKSLAHTYKHSKPVNLGGGR